MLQGICGQLVDNQPNRNGLLRAKMHVIHLHLHGNRADISQRIVQKRTKPLKVAPHVDATRLFECLKVLVRARNCLNARDRFLQCISNLWISLGARRSDRTEITKPRLFCMRCPSSRSKRSLTIRYGPSALDTMTRAFDAAWLQIRNRMNVRLQPEAFRLRLADAILRETRNGASAIGKLEAAKGRNAPPVKYRLERNEVRRAFFLAVGFWANGLSTDQIQPWLQYSARTWRAAIEGHLPARRRSVHPALQAQDPLPLLESTL